MPSIRYSERSGYSPRTLGECVDGIRRTGATYFAIVHDKPFLAGNRGLHHGQAYFGARERRLPMRWIARRQEAHFRELQRLAQFERRAQVTEMNRVERPAKIPIGDMRPYFTTLRGSPRIGRAQMSIASSAISSQASPVSRPLIMRSARTRACREAAKVQFRGRAARPVRGRPTAGATRAREPRHPERRPTGRASFC